MESVLDIVRHVSSEKTLRNLEDELKGILHCIAHDNQCEEFEWIKDRQKYISQTYGNFMNKINVNLFGYPATLIEDSYWDFLRILDSYSSSEDIRIEAEDILASQLELSYVFRLDLEEAKEALNLDEVPFPKYG